ncbi:MAG: TolC family protein [Saprospiraceae bacterium]|nr:TolC family protein [Saprospiraceae bacterium]
MKLNSIPYILLLILISLTSRSQVVEMSLDQVLDKVAQENIDLKIAQSDYEIREADFLQSRAMYYPNISFEYTGITTSSPLMAFGSKLNQSIITQNDFNPDLLNDPNAVENFSFRIKAFQPILNFDKKHQRSAAKLGMEASQYESQRIKEYLRFQTTQLYFQLQLTYQARDVIKQAIQTAKANQKIAVNNVEAGYMHQADLLLIDVRVNELENELQFTETQIQNLSDQILELFQEDEAYTILTLPEQSHTIDPMQSRIHRSRADFLAMDKAIQSYEEVIKSEEKKFLPSINAFAVFETNDNSPLALSGTNYLVGIQVGWNIFDGLQRSAKIQKAKANTEKSRLQKQKHLFQNENDLKRTLRKYNQLQSKLKTVQLSISHAEESLRIKGNRFEQGLEKATDILMAETIYAEKQLLEYQTIMEINIVSHYVEFLISTIQN